jgi:hypothetical protein
MVPMLLLTSYVIAVSSIHPVADVPATQHCYTQRHSCCRIPASAFFLVVACILEVDGVPGVAGVSAPAGVPAVTDVFVAACLIWIFADAGDPVGHQFISVLCKHIAPLPPSPQGHI